MIKFSLLHELSYSGNIGIQELMVFYNKANDQQKAELNTYLEAGDFKNAIELLALVTGVRLKVD